MTDQERAMLAAALRTVTNPSGHLGQELYEQIARFSTTVAFEAILLRKREGAIEVYMTQRQPHEAYAGQWHVPGSLFRRGEQPADVARRLSEREFKGIITRFQHVEDFFYQEERGWFESKVFLVEIPGQMQSGGTWFSVDALPQRTVPHHVEKIIPAAVQAFS